MSSIAITPINMFKSFEQAMREQLETQESETRSELKDRESEMCEVKINKARDSKIVEELRPLCEELPPDALDPVTMEPFEVPLVYRCGHVFDGTTVKSFILKNRLNNGEPLNCPTCRLTSGRIQIVQCIPLEGIMEHLKRVTNIFQQKAATKND